VALRAPGVTRRVVCEHCKALLDVTGDAPVVVSSLAKQPLWKDPFPIGATATIDRLPYMLVGCVQREAWLTQNPDGARRYWSEYVLYNPAAGIRSLVNVPRRRRSFWWWDGLLFRWYFLEPLPSSAVQPLSPKSVSYGGTVFRRHDYCEPTVKALSGEIPESLTVGQRSESTYYTHATELVAFEQTKSAASWYFGRLVPEIAVKLAFDPSIGAENPLVLDGAKAGRH
jgi:hypothetical protein